ncbi:K(+)/H(+) antiporter [Arachnomyces sp. PD_36]|nr:K(+)/H(+) antiporter [Arachnomyces sp. PD_36]
MTSVVTATVTATVSAASATSTASDNRAPPQGGVLDGASPSHYDPKNPITLFIIQAAIIVIFCRLLHYPLSKIRQPRVIAEVIGGILLGPSVMGRIPGFKDNIFPEESLPNLNLVATVGLVLFLFLVGVETDLRFLVSNWKVAVSVSAAGMILPFGLGCGIAYGLYNAFRDDPDLAPISFGTYVLFIGVAMAITAFPVLCRILTELKLLSTNVGVIVLSAGVGNDVVGWILLALCVALVNAGSGLTALWVLLTCVGYSIFLFVAVKPVFLWYLNRTGSLQDGPNQSVVTLTLLLAFASAFFTQIIGVHAIFGGFMVGLICPHEGGFAIKLTEKIEDLVGSLFLPLYFALSGLNTNLGLLDSGETWGYVVGVTAIAFFAKVTGGTVASRLTGLVWRESFTVGVLMSCKGLVELIVLNIGLQAKILSTRTFTIFIVMALITTFATTPLTVWLYPDWYQQKLLKWRRGEIDWDGNALGRSDPDSHDSDLVNEKAQASSIQRLLVYLRFDNMPSLFTFISLLGVTGPADPPQTKVHHLRQDSSESTAVSPQADGDDGAGKSAPSAVEIRQRHRPLQVHGVRLAELTDRASSVMKVSAVDEYTVRDPVVNTFRTFGQLNNVAVSAGLAVVPERSYAETITQKAQELSSDLILIPWSETGSMSEQQILLSGDADQKFAGGVHSTFIANILKSSTSNIGIFVNRGFGGPSLDASAGRPGVSRATSTVSIRSSPGVPTIPIADQSHHIFFPYFGGEDDRLALRFVLQLARNERVTATIVHIDHPLAVGQISAPPRAESSRDAASSAQLHGKEKEGNTAFFHSIRDSLPETLGSRVIFLTQTVSGGDDSDSIDPVAAAVESARGEVGRTRGNAGDLVVVGRNSMGRVSDSAHEGAEGEVGIEARRSFGVVGEAMVRKANGIRASVLVIQAVV